MISATEGNLMRLSLLRSPTEPDPKADQGTQEMSWAIYPHLGTLAESDVPQVAYAFNVPMKRKLLDMRRGWSGTDWQYDSHLL